MPLTSADFQELRIAIQDLTRAENDLREEVKRAREGVGGGGSASALAGSSSAAGVPGGGGVYAPRDGGSAPMPMGAGLGGMSRVMSSAGVSPAASLLSGAAAGPAGLAVAAAGVGASYSNYERERQQGINQASYGAYLKAPLTDTPEMLAKRQERAAERTQIQQGMDDRHSGIFNLDRWLMDENLKKELDRAGVGRLRQMDREDHEQLFDPKDEAMRRVQGQLRQFAEAGGMGTENGRKVADEIYRVELERTTRYINDMDAWAKRRDQTMTPGAPGSQGRLGAK